MQLLIALSKRQHSSLRGQCTCYSASFGLLPALSSRRPGALGRVEPLLAGSSLHRVLEANLSSLQRRYFQLSITSCCPVSCNLALNLAGLPLLPTLHCTQHSNTQILVDKAVLPPHSRRSSFKRLLQDDCSPFAACFVLASATITSIRVSPPTRTFITTAIALSRLSSD